MKVFKIFLFVFLSFAIQAQVSDAVYEKMYVYSDSIRKNNQAVKIDPQTVKMADSLTNAHPLAYFAAAAKLLEAFKYNDAAYIWAVGKMRETYYGNFTKYDRAFYDYRDAVSEPVWMFLRSNVDNVVAILKLAATYHLKHDYRLSPRDAKPDHYDEAAHLYERMAEQFSIHKSYFENMWLRERKEQEAYNQQK
ncbi:hypothetical protein [Flavobacterium sp.]|uniref:hypothetical protein n=1 Tax=Flavobacterium sp. TaxID=239 RepID=UPI00260B74D8|nr:hypothetical protein [Flavobacterium sp.]